MGSNFVLRVSSAGFSDLGFGIRDSGVSLGAARLRPKKASIPNSTLLLRAWAVERHDSILLTKFSASCSDACDEKCSTLLSSSSSFAGDCRPACGELEAIEHARVVSHGGARSGERCARRLARRPVSGGAALFVLCVAALWLPELV